MRMRRSLSFFCVIFIAHCISDSFISCTKSDELLREDLALSTDVQLNDEDYEIVQFWHKDFKSGDDNMKQLRFKRSGNDVQFTMKETSVIREKTPVWLVYGDDSIEKANENIINDAVKFYEHPELAITVATNFDQYNHLYFVGSISQQAVTPLSERTVRSLKTEKPHLFEDNLEPGSVDETGEFTLTNYHVIYKSKLPENGTLVLPPMGHPELFAKSKSKDNQAAGGRFRRTTADVVYPEILAVVDYNQKYTTIYELRFLNLLMYTIAFWNTVNHRYEPLKNPQIRLRLTGIAVLMHRRGLKAIRDATFDDMLDADRMINDVANWIYNNVKGEHDIIMIQTNSLLCRQKDTPKCERNALFGLANSGPGCPLYRENRMTGIIHDDMKHSGEMIAAHELGHILGAKHDDKKSPDDCKDTDGYIMTWNGNYNSKEFEWSRCSKEKISYHLNKILSSCLDNPAPSGKYQGELLQEDLLPGRRIDPEYQCLNKGYTRACEATDVCASLSCKWWWCNDVGPALEGTPCPDGECHNGKCVSKSN